MHFFFWIYWIIFRSEVEMVSIMNDEFIPNICLCFPLSPVILLARQYSPLNLNMIYVISPMYF